MKNQDFTTVILVDKSPQAAFDAIVNPRGWWSEGVEGITDRAGEEWVYRYKDMHVSKHETTELVPGRKVVWRTVDAQINFVKDKSEWKDTTVMFDIAAKDGKTEIRFTHMGLKPQLECFDACSGAWGSYIGGSLKSLIETGRGQPDAREDARPS